MLLVETSTWVAMTLQEAGYERLVRTLLAEREVGIAATTLAECLLVLERREGAEGVRVLEGLLLRFEAQVIPFDAAQARLAHEAFQRYGKGRHPAGLNFGDCLSYAAAKARGAKLLYVGDDFARTDLA